LAGRVDVVGAALGGGHFFWRWVRGDSSFVLLGVVFERLYKESGCCRAIRLQVFEDWTFSEQRPSRLLG
jgi:hypothetical protein